MVELCLFYEDATSCMYYAFKSFHLQKTLDRSICTNLTLSFLIICGKFTVLIIFPRLQELKYKIILSAMLLYFILFIFLFPYLVQNHIFYSQFLSQLFKYIIFACDNIPIRHADVNY